MKRAMANGDMEIIEFINLFQGSKNTFLFGLCYWFALILNKRFMRRGRIIYDPIQGHFLWKCGKFAYDADGRHAIPLRAKTLSTIRRIDSLWYKRIIRDCVMITKGGAI